MVTFAFGVAAPVGSVTVPVRMAPTTCASAMALGRANNARNNLQVRAEILGMDSLQFGIDGLYHSQDELKMTSWPVHLERARVAFGRP